MKFKNYLLTAASAALLAACGNDASDNNTTTDSASTNTSTTTTGTDKMTTTTVEVPAPTRTVFESKYPKASNVTWNHYQVNTAPIEWDWTGWSAIDENDYVASFNMDGSDYWVWYDDSGNWVGEAS